MIEIIDIKASINQRELILDPFIRNATFSYDCRHRLISYSGGFTVVFPCYVNNEKWAFRCWHANLEGTRERFKILSLSFSDIQLSYFTDFVYVNAGIIINGRPCPTTRMRWIDGVDLKTFIWSHRNNKGCLVQLGLDFLKMTEDLHSQSIAHGDLQHANIIVDSNYKLHLIDYDSMFVPELAPIHAKDIITGKPDYQHPARKDNVYANEKLDYFSEAIILCSILAIAYKPEFVEKYQLETSDALLFTRNDFENFSASSIYHDLSGLPQSIILLREVLTQYLTKDDINILAPIEETAHLLIGTSIPLSKYIKDSDKDFEVTIKEQKSEQEQRVLKQQDHIAWATACRWNTIDSYRTYLHNNPNGIHSTEAEYQISALWTKKKEDDESLWKRSKLLNVIGAYEKYIKEFPTGLHIEEAKQRHNKCLDDYDWAVAEKTNTESAIKAYLDKHPKGIHIYVAHYVLEEILRKQTGNLDWATAYRRNTIDSYRTYLHNNPDGIHIEEAKQRYNKCLDDYDWTVAEKTNTESAIKAYLNKHPTGVHIYAARYALEEISWKQAEKGNKIEYYEKYIRLYPNGRYVTTANERLQKLNELQILHVIRKCLFNISIGLFGLLLIYYLYLCVCLSFDTAIVTLALENFEFIIKFIFLLEAGIGILIGIISLVIYSEE